MYKTVKNVYKIIENIEKIIIGALFLILCATIFYVIINRNLGGQGLTWLEEFSRSTLIVTTYICGCVAVGEGRLTRLSLVPDALSKRWALLLDSCTNLISAAFMLWLGSVCARNILHLKMLGMMTTTLGIKTYVLYIPMAVGMFGMGLRMLLAAGENFVGFRKADKHKGKLSDKEKFEELMEKGE